MSNDNRTLSTPVDFVNILKRTFLSWIIILIFIIILTILGNTLVLVATWRERSLHQPNKYFIACLAVADLLVGIFSAPTRLYLSVVLYEQIDNFSGVFPQLNIHLCRYLTWMDILSSTASIYTLTVISFDRYLKISKPFQYKSRMTTSRSLKIIFIIWLISSCFATFAAIPVSRRSERLSMGEICEFEISTTFYTFLSTSVFFLPTIIILIMYTLIFLVAHKRRKMLRNGELGLTNNDESQRNTFLKDLKIIGMLSIVVGVFIVCWGPFFILLLLFLEAAKTIRNLSWKSRLIFSSAGFLLPPLNSVCNPIIYACLDQTYRKAFKQLFQRMMCRPNSSGLPPSGALELREVRTRQQNV